MANGVFTHFIPLTVFFGGLLALPQDMSTKFDFATQNPMIQTCLKNSGSSAAYTRITVALDKVGACLNENATDTADLYQGRGCPQWEQDRTCLNPLIDSALSCLTGSRKQNRVFLDKLANEIIQMKCTIDQIKDWSETEKDGYASSNLCIRDKVKSVIDCDAPFLGKNIKLSDYDGRECSQLSRSKICIMDIFRTCRAGKILVDVVDMVYNVAHDVNKCSGVLERFHSNKHK